MIVLSTLADATQVPSGLKARAWMGQPGTHATAPALYPNLAYNPDVDFEPVGTVSTFPVVVVARKDFPARDLKEFVAYVKANSEKLNEANAGVGSVSYTTCVFLDSLLGAKPTRVVYRGTGPALNDLVSGQVDYMCDQIVNLVPQIQAGTIKAYGVAHEVIEVEWGMLLISTKIIAVNIRRRPKILGQVTQADGP
jgi:tripartite-type tricarboxylate transporter receptor subunit TctC